MTTPGAGRSSIGVRVRPNADNFIRELGVQLKARKYTYWVDVRAQTAPATKDVNQWAKTTLKGIKAQVPVGADMSSATRSVASWKRQISTLGNAAEIKVRSDTTAATANVKAWRAAVSRDLDIKVKANIDARNVAATKAALSRETEFKVKPMLDRSNAQFQRNLDQFLADQKVMRITPELDLDNNVKRTFDRQVKALTDRQQKIKLKIEADDRDFRKVMGNLHKEGKLKLRSQLEIDVEEAENKLTRLQTQALAKKLGVTVDVDADPTKANMQLRLLKLKAAATKLEVKAEVKTRGFDTFLKTLSDVEKRMGSFTLIRSLDFGPFNLGRPTGLIGTLTTLTALAGAVPGVVTGVSALSDVFMRLAGTVSILPGAIAAAGASLSTFAIGTIGVGDTIGAMFDLWTEGASEQASTARRSIQAQDQYRNALVDEQKAQEDLADARKDALSDLRNLNNELRGSVLNEAQAILDAQKARDRYAQGLAKGFDNETDRVQGLLDIAKADQNILDVRERNIQLQDRVNTANNEGIEGSDRVTAAIEAQTRAQQQAAQAMEAMASTQATGALGKYNDLLAQLSPNAQQFMNTLMGLRGPMEGFRNEIQDLIFQGLGPAFESMFNNLMPVVGPGMRNIAAAINDNILTLFDSLQSPQGQSIIERILGGTAEAQQMLSGLIDPLVRGFGTLMAAGTEHLPQMVDLFTRLADRFATFIEEADRSGALDKFMDEGITALSNLAELGINLIQIVGDLGKAFGGDLLASLVRVTDKWHEFLSSDEGQAKIKGFIADAKALWDEWKPVLEHIAFDILPQVSDAAKRVLDVLLPVLDKIFGFLSSTPGLIEGFALAWMGGKMLGAVAVVGRFAGLLGTIATHLLSLAGFQVPAWMNRLPGAAGAPAAGAPGVGAVLGPATAAVAGAAIPGAIAAAGAADAGVGTGGQVAAFGAGAGAAFTPGVAVLPLLMQNDQFAQNTFGTADENARRQLKDAIWKKFEENGKKPEDAVKLYGAGARPDMSREDLEKLAATLAGLPSFEVGGFTNWAPGRGQLAELHGKEYVQPADTTAFYGVDAMEAIHRKRVPKGLLQSFSTGGFATAHPNDNWGPGWFDKSGKGDVEGGSVGAGTGNWINRPSGHSTGGFQIAPYPKGGPTPGWGRPGIGAGLGSPGGWGAFEQRRQMLIEAGLLPAFQGGGYYDPNGQWVEPHGPTATRATEPNPAGGTGIIDTLTTGATNLATHGVSVASQAASTVQGFTQQFTPGAVPGQPLPGLDGIVAPPNSIPGYPNLVTPPNSIPGYPNLVQTPGMGTGPLPGPAPDIPGSPGYTGPLGPAPGQTTSSIAGLQPTTGANPLVDSLLGGLGIPGLSPQTTEITPGWGPEGPPAGLGGGGFDIRNFGIGPGPPGSGPNNWLAFTGKELGAFGSGLVSSFAEGVLGFFGLQGVMQSDTFAAVSKTAEHFLTAGTKGDDKSIQAPGADETNAQTLALLDTLSAMPTNPTSGYTQMPTVFDPSTGSAVPGGVAPSGAPGALNPADMALGSGSKGLQPATARGEQVIKKYFPWATNIGGVRSDPLPWHPNGLALDVMTDPGHDNNDPSSPEGLAKGNALYAWLKANQKALGIDYILWQEKDHYNHLHVNFSPSGGQSGNMPAVSPPPSATTARNPGGWGGQNWTPKGAVGPAASAPPPKKKGGNSFIGGSLMLGGMPSKVMDRGGVLGPGTTVVHNYTGKPELVVPSYALGGFSQAAVPPPRPAPVMPKPTPIIPMQPKPAPAKPQAPARPQAPPPSMMPKQSPPSVTPNAPPAATPPAPHGGTGAAPGPAAGGPGAARPSNMVSTGPFRPATGAPPSETGDHLHPALRKGITSGFAAAGQAASTAISVAASLAAGAGGSGFSPGAGAVGALGAIGPYVQGLFMQAGKIANDVANVGSSFLVGNITGGTTENAYGVTQRGSSPSGGTRVVDASNNQYGDIYTNNLDEYFSMVRRRDDQKAQATLGHWGR